MTVSEEPVSEEPVGGMQVPADGPALAPVRAPSLYIRDAVLVQVLTYLFMFVCAIGLFVYYATQGYGDDHMATPEAQADILVLTYVCLTFVMVALIWLFARRRGLTARDLGLGATGVRYFGLAAVCFVLVYGAAHYLDTWIDPSVGGALEEMSRGLLGGARIPAYVSFVFVALLVPFAEELFFRGVLIRSLQRRMPVILAAAISMLMFTAFHLHYFWLPGNGGPIVLLEVFILSAGLTVPFLLSGSIWPSVLIHAVWNGLVFLPLALDVAGPAANGVS